MPLAAGPARLGLPDLRPPESAHADGVPAVPEEPAARRLNEFGAAPDAHPVTTPAQLTSSTRETRITVHNNGNPQLAPAMALVELLREHPELPAVSWDIQESGKPTLHGHIHRGDMGALRAYAEALGGGIRPVQDFELGGRPVRSHYLTTVWRDVPVELVVVVPLPVLAGAVSA